jgi:hypothetical protein
MVDAALLQVRKNKVRAPALDRGKDLALEELLLPDQKDSGQKH